MSFKSKFRRFKLHLYVNIILGILCAIFLLNMLIYSHNYLLFFVACFAVVFIPLILSERRRRRKALELQNEIDEKSIPFIRFFDRYNRRLINWIFVAYFEVFTFIFSLVSLGINSKPFEFLEKYNANRVVFDVVAFFIIKNLVLVKWFSKNHSFDNELALKKLLKKVIIISTIYWLVASAIFYFCEEILVLNSSK